MPNYDGVHFDPPAPSASVTIRNPVGGESASNVELLIDSGADLTLLPRSCVQQLGITIDPSARYELVGFDGQSVAADSVVLDMVFQNKLIHGRYVLTDNAIGILGRDVLNLLSIELDGPAGEWRANWPE